MKHNTVCTKQYLPNKYISQLYDDLKYDGQKGQKRTKKDSPIELNMTSPRGIPKLA